MIHTDLHPAKIGVLAWLLAAEHSLLTLLKVCAP